MPRKPALVETAEAVAAVKAVMTERAAVALKAVVPFKPAVTVEMAWAVEFEGLGEAPVTAEMTAMVLAIADLRYRCVHRTGNGLGCDGCGCCGCDGTEKACREDTGYRQYGHEFHELGLLFCFAPLMARDARVRRAIT